MTARHEVICKRMRWNWDKQDRYEAKHPKEDKPRIPLEIKVPKRVFKDRKQKNTRKYVKAIKFTNRMKAIFKEGR